jgi:hypothetical protein
MSFRHRLPWLAALVIVLSLGFAACSDEEGGDSRNIVDVVSLNNNGPLVSDVWEWVDDKDHSKGGYIPLELVQVVFQSRPHDGTLTIGPGKPFGSVRFSRYDVTFEDPNHTDGADLDGDGTVDLKNFSIPINVVVPTGQTGSANLQIISFENKATPPVLCLGPLEVLDSPSCAGNMAVDYQVNAIITFHGVEETSGDTITLTRGLGVTLADIYGK